VGIAGRSLIRSAISLSVEVAPLNGAGMFDTIAAATGDGF
jgi:hypothetical protein